jgi:hypothetical protein
MHPRTIELLAYLDEHRNDLREAFFAVPPSQRAVAPAPDRWSAASIIEHVALVEGLLAQRLVTEIAAGVAAGLERERDDSPVLPTFFAATARLLDRRTRLEAPRTAQPTGLDADAAWAAFDQANHAVRSALRAGDGLALRERYLSHRLFGNMPLYYYFAFVGAHEARHAEQLRELAREFTERTHDDEEHSLELETIGGRRACGCCDDRGVGGRTAESQRHPRYSGSEPGAPRSTESVPDDL